MNSRLRWMTAGESHGPALTAILDGMPAGLRVSSDDLGRDLARRRGLGAGGRPYTGASARMRLEQDTADIVGGVMAGKTTGGPVAVCIANADHPNWRAVAVAPITVPRAGHADLTGAVKYGHDDLRLSLERASARETAARVALGAVCRRLLDEFGIRVGSYVIEIAGAGCSIEGMSFVERLDAAEASSLRCPDGEAAAAMDERIREIARARASAGGVFEVVALGVPPGLGSYASWDRRLSARLAAAVMSVPAIKGVEIGDGFGARRNGTSDLGAPAHDEIRLAADGNTLEREGNHSGGIEGGITTGDTLLVRAAMKPLATTVAGQRSVDLAARAASNTAYQRSDVCAVPRAAVVAEAMVCYVLADALLEKLGGDSIEEMRPRYAALRRARLTDLSMRTEPTVYWE